MSVSGADSKRVYALVEHENGGLFSSSDAGATWTLVNSNRNIRQRAFYYTHVVADPKNADTVYMLNVSAYRSTDGGKTLTNVGQGTHGDHHDLWIDPDDPQHLVIGNDGGGAVSMAGGKGWTAQDFPTPQYYHVATTKHVPYHVCGAQQDGSTVCLPSDTGLGGGRPVAADAAGRRRPRCMAPGGSEPGYIAPDPKDPDIFFAGGNNGTFMTRLNRRTGEAPRGQSLSAHLFRRAVERNPRTLAVDVSDRLLAGRSERALHLVPARLEDDERRSDLGGHQRRS